MDYPMLDGHFSKEDVHSKGKGSFAADYISWAKVAQVVRKHAPGWRCTLVPDNEGNVIWSMPDGTACLYFQWFQEDGGCMEWFPYAITVNNKPCTAGADCTPCIPSYDNTRRTKRKKMPCRNTSTSITRSIICTFH